MSNTTSKSVAKRLKAQGSPAARIGREIGREVVSRHGSGWAYLSESQREAAISHAVLMAVLACEGTAASGDEIVNHARTLLDAAREVAA